MHACVIVPSPLLGRLMVSVYSLTVSFLGQGRFLVIFVVLTPGGCLAVFELNLIRIDDKPVVRYSNDE